MALMNHLWPGWLSQTLLAASSWSEEACWRQRLDSTCAKSTAFSNGQLWPMRDLCVSEGPLVEHQSGKWIWHQKCLLWAKSIGKWVGRLDTQNSYLQMELIEHLKNGTLGLPNPIYFSAAAWCLSVLLSKLREVIPLGGKSPACLRLHAK